ncbi:MAG: dihydrolipoyl dehydrogenase family protein [Candidatus Bilamarchaeum sp.]|jgi:dihydrolipoamide dehydrogenase
MIEKFDLIVIGGGSGLDVSSAAASSGLKVAVVEPGPMGGTCLNRGCIPTKILVHSADVIQLIKRSSEFGIKSKIENIDFSYIIKNCFKEIDQDAANIEQGIKSSKNIKLFKEYAKFSGPKKIKLKNCEITADKILIAAGTRPALPPIEGLDKVPYLTSDNSLRLEKLPPELIIIGGGYIAVELAHFFGSLGSKITILQRNVRLIPDEDEEISNKFTDLFSRQYNVHLKFAAKKVEQKNGRIVVYDKDGKSVDGTHLLIATGRVPTTDTLDIEKTGLKANASGYLEVDDYLESPVKGIWALGDIIGRYLFKHSANLEAEHAIKNMFGEEKEKVDYTAMPHAIFSYPQVAGVGKTEQELKQSGEDYLVGKYEYAATGMGLALHEKEGFVKFLTDFDGKILGCHIIGPEAATLIHEVLVSMKAGKCHVNDILDTIHIHPALNEVVQRAASEI